MSKSSKSPAMFTEPKNESTRLVAFNQEEVYGGAVNITVHKKNLTLQDKVMLNLQALLWGKSSEVHITKIIITWNPLVEPNSSFGVSLSLNYDIGDDIADLDDNRKILKVTGKASEQIMIEHRPTHPIIKRKDRAFYNPWISTLEVDDVMDSDKKHMLGIVKCWCYLNIKLISSEGRMQSKMYQVPKVTWNNQYFPYYVPLIATHSVRGINVIRWRDTAQYKSYTSDIAAHISRSIIKPELDLGIMQTMSQEDFQHMKRMTTDCHFNKGGTCSCGDGPTQFMSSVIHNSSNKYADHGTKFDDIVKSVITGKIKYITDNMSVCF